MSALAIVYLPKIQLAAVADTDASVQIKYFPEFGLGVIIPVAAPPVTPPAPPAARTLGLPRRHRRFHDNRLQKLIELYLWVDEI